MFFFADRSGYFAIHEAFDMQGHTCNNFVVRGNPPKKLCSSKILYCAVCPCILEPSQITTTLCSTRIDGLPPTCILSPSYIHEYSTITSLSYRILFVGLLFQSVGSDINVKVCSVNWDNDYHFTADFKVCNITKFLCIHVHERRAPLTSCTDPEGFKTQHLPAIPTHP